jgi:hypothetical protein
MKNVFYLLFISILETCSSMEQIVHIENCEKSNIIKSIASNSATVFQHSTTVFNNFRYLSYGVRTFQVIVN